MTVNISKATEGDIPGIAEIARESFPDPWSEEGFRAELCCVNFGRVCPFTPKALLLKSGRATLPPGVFTSGRAFGVSAFASVFTGQFPGYVNRRTLL